MQKEGRELSSEAMSQCDLQIFRWRLFPCLFLWPLFNIPNTLSLPESIGSTQFKTVLQEADSICVFPITDSGYIQLQSKKYKNGFCLAIIYEFILLLHNNHNRLNACSIFSILEI